MSRASNGMLMLDFKNKVSIDKIDFDQSIYTVIMEIYLFEAEYASTLFCLDINLTTTTATEASWCLSLYQSPGNFTMSSELLNSTHIFTNTIESAREFSGWQALQFSLEYIPEDFFPTPPVEAKSELSYRVYGDDTGTIGALTTTTVCATDNNTNNPDGTLGRMVLGTSETQILSGILDFLLICDTTNTATCGYIFRTRANFVNDKLQMYTYHWPLVANYTVLDQKQTKSYEFLLKNYS
ncbi:unnamed protein product [Moneuplotes crassus]|uniref:Uncharacterized protein n=1 Tax=Euplotes crassus TaxID=5936 RepID=A0AAD1X6L2_EUPCR|nr:unnamed protein product [Moneuplotes crassus]